MKIFSFQNNLNFFEIYFVMLCQYIKSHQILHDLNLSTHNISFRKFLFFFIFTIQFYYIHVFICVFRTRFLRFCYYFIWSFDRKNFVTILNRFNSCVNDRSIKMKNNFKIALKFDKFKKKGFNKSQNVVNKTQKKTFCQISKNKWKKRWIAK